MKTEFKHPLTLLSDISNRIEPADGGLTFSPVLRLIKMELEQRRHSEQYIKDVFENGIIEFHKEPRTMSDTILTVQRIYKTWANDVILNINLADIKRSPYWLVSQLIEWGFDLDYNNEIKAT